jgi:simple sugar transport system permease protein
MDAFSPGYGMTGVLIALVAKNNPVAVALVAFIFSLVKTGAGGMELAADVPAELSEVLLTLIVFMLAAQRSLRGTLRAARTQQHAGR